MIHRGTWSAPANLLLAGEYAITREGGAGLAVAVEPRGVLDLYEYNEDDEGIRDSATLPPLPLGGGATLTVRARMGGQDRGVPGAAEAEGATGKPTDRGSDAPANRGAARSDAAAQTLVTAVVAESSGAAEERGAGAAGREVAGAEAAGARARHWHAEIDTSAFFHPNTGKKRGLGSSAVATLLLVTALQEIRSANLNHPDHTHRDRSHVDRDTVIRTAIAAHRRAHNGRGSGYDIATSGTGGAIRFTGGEKPTWDHINAVSRWREAEISIHSASGRSPVSSSLAVERFNHHVPAATDRERAFLHGNNDLVDRIISATEWRELCTALTDAARHGVAIGEEIGVTAALPFVASHADDGWVAKASGAGNERSVFFVRSDHRRPLPPTAHELTLAPEGLRCDYLNL